MAVPFDVAGRLAEARPVIGDVEEYVAACGRLGYQHHDLTMHRGQVGDWYDGEDGLDLAALDADHGVLRAAASAAEEAVRMQTDVVAQLAAAWSGRGGASAHDFVSRSCQAATSVAAAIRAAADAVATLRDALWRAVDAKAQATEAMAGKQQPHQTEWLAAARTVTTGAGDVAAASELIDQQVKPFVDLDVGSDWLAAMRTAASSIDAAYSTAIASATAPAAVFGVPGALGPRPGPGVQSPGRSSTGDWEPSEAPRHTVPAAAVGSAPMAAAPAAPPAAPPWSSPPWSNAPVPDAAPPMPASAPVSPPGGASGTPPMPSMGDLGGGPSTAGSGLGQQIADLIGGLIGSAEGTSDAGGVDSPDSGNSDDPRGTKDFPDDPKDLEDGTTGAEKEGDGATDDPVDPADDGTPQPDGEPVPAAEPPAAEPMEDVSVPTPVPLPPDPPPPAPDVAALATPDGDPPTPCEIAADELPQVGEAPS